MRFLLEKGPNGVGMNSIYKCRSARRVSLEDRRRGAHNMILTRYSSSGYSETLHAGRRALRPVSRASCMTSRGQVARRGRLDRTA